MVRLILILLLLNMFYFGWNATQGTSTANVGAKSVLHEQSRNIGSLQLLGEVSKIESDESMASVEREVELIESAVIDELPEESAATQFANPQCIQLVEGVASDLVDSLEKTLVDLGFSVRFTTEKKDLDPHYWVIYPPMEGFAAAKALYNQLLSAGFDSFVIPSGQQRNGVSLGLFNDQQTALEKAKEIAALNFTSSEPVILRHERIERREFAYIPVADDDNAAQVSDQLTNLELKHAGPQNCPEFAEIISEAE